MKKNLGVLALGLSLCAFLVGCASTGKNEAFVSSVSHPRTYVIDLADAKSGNVSKFKTLNDTAIYGSNNDFTDFLKFDPPQIGDTFEVHYKGVSDIDIPGIELCISNHSTWNNLISQDQCELALAEDIKAGVPFEGVKTYTLDGSAPSAKSAVFFDLYYDNCLIKNDPAKYPVTGKAAKITWEKTVETTNTALDAGEVVTRPEGELTFDINIADAMKLIQWEVGDADGNVVTNYKTFMNVTECPQFKYYLPKKGDTVNFVFKGTSDAEIQGPIIYALVDQSEAAGWWKEVGADNWSMSIADYVPAGEEFTISGSMKLASDCVGGLTVFAIYNAYEGATGALWKFVRE
ncbi:MAG: hypothetical protein MJ188_10000 [Treponema sp.]|nr:hypothetical protein [Treponema sp.]